MIVHIGNDPSVSDVVQLVLKDAGLQVLCIQTTQEFRELLEKPELLLLNNHMKDAFGHEFCKELKQDPTTGNIPVILMSSNDFLEEIAKNCGADAFIKKPFDIDELTGIVKKFI